ncbi:MAG: N-acetylmuramoyl-L-alanine amidase [Proteobacteria bacterium]|nr:N-acetylmuramoyl-L-alanine amidase [Pseudomonadota bacterium]
MKIVERPSPNQDARGGVGVDMLVLHYTGMVSGEAALARLCDPAAKVSAHYTIDEDGTVYAMVPEAQRAWHAGLSFWAGARDVNARSIGIELVNPGHEFGYRPFPMAQIGALAALCHQILNRHSIPAWRVLGHSDVAPARKDDPGELFPWKKLAGKGIGLWPAPGGDPGDAAVPALLARHGYDPDVPLEKTITAFQRHFRPSRVDGIADRETRTRLSGLIAACG